MPRLLLLNPNTSTAMTALVRAAVEPRLPAGTEILSCTARFGAPVIATEVAQAIAAHASVDALEQAGSGFDLVLHACFGEAGLFALREAARVPVVAPVTAALAACGDRRFAVLTGGAAWQPMLQRLYAGLGAQAQLTGIYTLAGDSAALAAAGEEAFPALRATIDRARDAGAQVVVIGGAALTGLAARLQPQASLPLIDGLLAAADEAAHLLGAATQ